MGNSGISIDELKKKSEDTQMEFGDSYLVYFAL